MEFCLLAFGFSTATCVGLLSFQCKTTMNWQEPEILYQRAEEVQRSVYNEENNIQLYLQCLNLCMCLIEN